MTTTVTVTTHSWPVQVSTFPCVDGEPDPQGQWSALDRVEPHSQQIFHVHSGADFLVQELPLPEQPDG